MRIRQPTGVLHEPRHAFGFQLCARINNAAKPIIPRGRRHRRNIGEWNPIQTPTSSRGRFWKPFLWGGGYNRSVRRRRVGHLTHDQSELPSSRSPRADRTGTDSIPYYRNFEPNLTVSNSNHTYVPSASPQAPPNTHQAVYPKRFQQDIRRLPALPEDICKSETSQQTLQRHSWTQKIPLRRFWLSALISRQWLPPQRWLRPAHEGLCLCAKF